MSNQQKWHLGSRWLAWTIALMWLCMGIADAAGPVAGATVTDGIVAGLGKRIPLPPGQFKVVASFDEPVNVRNDGGAFFSGMTTREQQILTLQNQDPAADVQAVVLEYTSFARLTFAGQPCDEATATGQLRAQAFGSTASSIMVKCNRTYLVENFAASIRAAASSSNAWIRTRQAPLATAPTLPAHAVVVRGYLSRSGGDRLLYWIYLNATLHGLADQTGRPVALRNPPAGSSRHALAERYLEALNAWGDSYTLAIERSFFRGGGGERLAAFVPFDATPAAAATQAGASAIAAAPPTPPAQAEPTTQADSLASIKAVPAPSGAVQPLAPQPVLTVQVTATVPPAALPPALPPPLPRVHALVIGNSNYPSARLANPRNDAQAISQRFASFGFKVTTAVDTTRKQLVEALASFAAQASNADVSIVFYAGHGMQVAGVNYLIPVDLDLSGARTVSVPLEAVSLDTVVQQHMPGTTRLVFLDACRDNPLARSLAGVRGGSLGLAPVQVSSGTLISYATKDGATAADGAGRNSPYTSSLLAYLDAAEDIALVLRRVRQQVLADTGGRQEPWEYGSLVGGSLVLSRIATAR